MKHSAQRSFLALRLVVGLVLTSTLEPVAILELVMDRSLYLAKLNSEQIHLLMIGLCALVLGIIFSILLTRSIVSPLKNAGDRMDDIANGEGDLTQRLRHRQQHLL